MPLDLAEMWEHMCPAQVYEVGGADGDGTVQVEVNPSNCVQCGAITAKGGRLTRPRAGRAPSTRSPSRRRSTPAPATPPAARPRHAASSIRCSIGRVAVEEQVRPGRRVGVVQGLDGELSEERLAAAGSRVVSSAIQSASSSMWRETRL